MSNMIRVKANHLNHSANERTRLAGIPSVFHNLIEGNTRALRIHHTIRGLNAFFCLKLVWYFNSRIVGGSVASTSTGVPGTLSTPITFGGEFTRMAPSAVASSTAAGGVAADLSIYAKCRAYKKGKGTEGTKAPLK